MQIYPYAKCSSFMLENKQSILFSCNINIPSTNYTVYQQLETMTVWSLGAPSGERDTWAWLSNWLLYSKCDSILSIGEWDSIAAASHMKGGPWTCLHPFIYLQYGGSTFAVVSSLLVFICMPLEFLWKKTLWAAKGVLRIIFWVSRFLVSW
jgi:hypothetical protein